MQHFQGFKLCSGSIIPKIQFYNLKSAISENLSGSNNPVFMRLQAMFGGDYRHVFIFDIGTGI